MNATLTQLMYEIDRTNGTPQYINMVLLDARVLTNYSTITRADFRCLLAYADVAQYKGYRQHKRLIDNMGQQWADSNGVLDTYTNWQADWKEVLSIFADMFD